MRLALLLFCATLSAQTPPPVRGVNFYTLEKEKALGAQQAGDYRIPRIPGSTRFNGKSRD